MICCAKICQLVEGRSQFFRGCVTRKGFACEASYWMPGCWDGQRAGPQPSFAIMCYLESYQILPYSPNLEKSQYKLKSTWVFLLFWQPRILTSRESVTINFSAIGYMPGRHPWQPQNTCLYSNWRQLLALLLVTFPLKERAMRNYCKRVILEDMSPSSERAGTGISDRSSLLCWLHYLEV